MAHGKTELIAGAILTLCVTLSGASLLPGVGAQTTERDIVRMLPPDAIGVAWMEPDGTIRMNLRAEGPGGIATYMVLEELAKAIVDQRKQQGLTQHQLAQRAGVSRLLVARLETGRLPEIGAKKLIRILNAAGLDLRLTSLNKQRPTLEDLLADDEEGGRQT